MGQAGVVGQWWTLKPGRRRPAIKVGFGLDATFLRLLAYMGNSESSLL